MARRNTDSPEISLFPFLSILVCLIGTLVLLIVVMTLAQSKAGDGRTPEEMQRALAYRAAEKRLAELKATETTLLAKSQSASQQIIVMKSEQAKLLTLQADLKALETSPEDKTTDAELQKQLELAISQIKALAKEYPALESTVAALKKQLAAENKRLTTAPPLIVQPGGSGLTKTSALCFVETTAAGLILHQKGKPPVRLSTASIGTDQGYNTFLTTAKKSQATVLFLLRPDGLATYNLAAGLAENDFELQTGKLPLPGNGPVDLSLFGLPKSTP